MARRNSSTKEKEQGTKPAENKTEAQAEVKEETPIDLTAFEQSVSAAIEQRDGSTGEVPSAAIEDVNKAYRELDGIKPKNAAKNLIENAMKEAVEKLDVQLARGYSMLRNNLSAGTTRTEKAPVDPKVAYVNRLAAHRLAMRLISSNAPEGVDFNEADSQSEELATSLAEQVTAYQTWANAEVPEGEERPEAPEVSPVVRSAFKLASGKASGTGRVSGGGSGVRRDIGKHIASAFAGVESGATLTVAEIANHRSEEYGDDSPSQGAVSARLFPKTGKCTVEGIEPVPAQDGKARGAKKL